MRNNSAEYYNDAFHCIFNKYKNRVYGFVFTLSHSHYTAEEITQEIFMKLWICRDILNDIDNLDSYIFTMARNKTLNHLRKAGNNEKLLFELKNAMSAANNNAEESIRAYDFDKLLHEALALLSPQRRLVYQLSRDQNMNHKEIAKHLNLSRHTVKNHLTEALRFIRNHLGKHIAAALLFFLLLC